MDDTNDECQETIGAYHSSDPSLSEMLAVISESPELTQNLQDLMLSSTCTSQNSCNSTITSTCNSTESKAKQELAELGNLTVNPPSDSRTTTAVTTNLTCYDKNSEPINVSLLHRDSLKFNVVVENCENVVVGDNADVNICCGQEGPLKQNKSFGSTEIRPNGTSSLVQADGDINPAGLSRRKGKKRVPSEKTSDKKSATKKKPKRKIKTEWRFPLYLSDFTDSGRLQNGINTWLTNLRSSLLSEAQDLDNFESVIELLEEAMKLRVSSVPNCIQKLAEAIQTMRTMVENEDGEKYNVLFTETQFALAEFYIKEENYLSALQCLRSLEGSLCDETEKSRLHAKIAKILEHCLEYSVDFTVELLGAPINALVSNRNPNEVVLCYLEKALTFSNEEPSVEKREMIQRCCYLGKAAVYMGFWKGQIESGRNLPEVRRSLLSTERLFNGISPAMKCQFYLTEAYLFYYEGGYQMAVDKIRTAYKIADEEDFLERKCLGSKRLHFLLAELDKSTDVSKLAEELLT